MKSVAVVALSVLTLAGSVAGSEARGFRLRGSISAPVRYASSHDVGRRRTPRVAAVGTIGAFDPARADTTVVTRSVMTAEAQSAEESAHIPPMPPAPATLAVQKHAEPWCKSGRIAGNGTGFCLIN